MKNKTKFRLRKEILLLCLLASLQARSETGGSSLDDNLVFDENMFRGNNVTPSILESLSAENSVLPGHYDNVSIIVNGYQVGENNVVVSEYNKRSVICLSEELLNQAGFIDEYIKKFNALKKKTSCVSLADIAKSATIKINTDLSLEITAPQAFLKNRNSGEIHESALNRGEPVLFTNYTANYFHNRQTGSGSGDSDYVYLNLNGGLNFGLWQYRQLSNYSYSKSTGEINSTSSSNWNSVQSYFQRPLYSLKSNLKLGKTNTSGQFFGGLMYTGVELSSDESMYPVSEQGYAPVITGIAKSNALVEVKQNNTVIYQTTVPPGPFDIRDLSPTSYNGDLNVTVTEADGKKNSFVVPFSAVPDSVRAGKIKYTLSSGRTRALAENKVFMDSALQYGLNNFLTLGGGLRTASNYTAGTMSSVFTTGIGAFGVNTTYSNANLGGRVGVKQGWMTNVTYSKTFQATNTNIALAGYRYSTEGYREFSDFVYEQHYIKTGSFSDWSSNTYQQKYRLTGAVNQPLGDFGNLSVSTSTQEYNSGRSRDIYFQGNYNKTIFNNINMSLSVTRQKRGAYYRNNIDQPATYDTVTMLSFDIPLGNAGTSLSTSIYHDKDNGDQYQSSLSGNFGEQQQPYNYSVNVNHNEHGSQTSYSGSLYKQYPVASVSANAAKGQHYSQAGMSAIGAVVVHSGGVILGPYLGNTFGIVEAKGAAGAQVYNGQGATINSSGFALVPSLTPYRYNSVGITSDGMANNNVDIDASEQRIAPYSGTAVKIKFNTSQGYPLLISLMTKNKTAIPIGSSITDEKGNNIGLVGQNNQAYFRGENTEGHITVTWGDKSNEKCVAKYRINDDQINENLIKLSAQCI